MNELRRNHRVFGRVVAEAGLYTVLETAAHQFTAALTTELLPVTEREAEFEIRMQAGALIERARLLGVPMERVEELLREEAA